MFYVNNAKTELYLQAAFRGAKDILKPLKIEYYAPKRTESPENVLFSGHGNL